MAPLRLFSDEAKDLCSPNAPPGFPRIIAHPEALDDQTLIIGDLDLPDVIATLLFEWNPEALRQFLNLYRGKFEYVLERPNQLTVLIARMGQNIHVELHSDGYAEGSATITYLLSKTGEWKTKFGYMDLSPTYDPDKIKEYATQMAVGLLKGKAWVDGEGITHKVQWTKLPGEEGYKLPYDRDQQEFFGLPKGWEGMNDEEIMRAQKESRVNKPFEDRDKWPFELIEPTVC